MHHVKLAEMASYCNIECTEHLLLLVGGICYTKGCIILGGSVFLSFFSLGGTVSVFGVLEGLHIPTDGPLHPVLYPQQWCLSGLQLLAGHLL